MRKPKDHRLFVSLSPVEKRVLRSEAKKLDLNMSQLVRRMIRELVERGHAHSGDVHTLGR